MLSPDGLLWESGYWALSESKAKSLIGGEILFHHGQLQPSYMGGRITSFRLQIEGEFKDRVIFEFEPNEALIGLKTSKEGWGNEKKIVLTESSSDKHSKTARTSKTMWGNKLYQTRAQLALPILIYWAKKQKKLTYVELANELDMLHHRPTNKILGSVGATLKELSDQLGYEIPPIQVLVINKSTSLPGAGVGWFISEEKYADLSKREKQELVDKWHQKVFDFEKWDEVQNKLGLDAYTSVEYSSERLRRCDQRTEESPAKEFFKWLSSLRSQKTAKNYSQAIGGTLSKMALDEGWVNESIFETKSAREFSSLSIKFQALNSFVDLDSRGNGMYRAALNAYKEYLNEALKSDVDEDLDGLLDDDSLESTTRSALVKTRLGQGIFRQKLVRYWKGCSVTGYRDLGFLVASHIKPWRSSSDGERLSVFNGLLLTPNLDKAFDSGLITFKETGRILISSDLERPELIGIEEKMVVKFESQHLENIGYHRETVFSR